MSWKQSRKWRGSRKELFHAVERNSQQNRKQCFHFGKNLLAKQCSPAQYLAVILQNSILFFRFSHLLRRNVLILHCFLFLQRVIFKHIKCWRISGLQAHNNTCMISDSFINLIRNFINCYQRDRMAASIPLSSCSLPSCCRDPIYTLFQREERSKEET